MNAWSLLPLQLDGQVPPARLDERSIIHVSGMDPYAWKGHKQSARAVYQRTCDANRHALQKERS